jgi:hypothetical protein
VMLTLVRGFLRRGHAVDIVVGEGTWGTASTCPAASAPYRTKRSRVIFTVPALVRYLRRERPMALLSTLYTANAVAIMARIVARGCTRVVIRQAAHLSRDSKRGRVGRLLC